jgi:hypothetical protein
MWSVENKGNRIEMEIARGLELYFAVTESLALCKTLRVEWDRLCSLLGNDDMSLSDNSGDLDHVAP